MPRISSAVLNRGSLRPLPVDEENATSHSYRFSVTTKKPVEEEPAQDLSHEAEELKRKVRDRWARLEHKFGPSAVVLGESASGRESGIIIKPVSLADIGIGNDLVEPCLTEEYLYFTKVEEPLATLKAMPYPASLLLGCEILIRSFPIAKAVRFITKSGKTPEGYGPKWRWR